MNSVMNKTRLAEKQVLKKQYEQNKRRVLIRKQNKLNKELKQNERRRKRENIIDEDIDLGEFFELAAGDKIYINSLNLH